MRQLKWVPLLRLLHRLLPLQHRWLWLVNQQLGQAAEATVPWGPYSLAFSTTWREPSAVINPIFLGPSMNPELELVRQMARERPVGAWVDVGANIGCYVLALRQLTAGKIIAYEPLPQLFRFLQMNVVQNELPDVTLKDKACGEKGGSALMVPGANASIEEGCGQDQSSGMEAVDVVCLDEDLRGEQIGFIKIDVEGFEIHVLRGARHILEQQRPHLFIEVHPNLLRRYGGSASDLIALLSKSYDLSFWDYGTEHSRSRLARILARYFAGTARRLSSADEFLQIADGSDAPPQLFVIGIPRGGSSRRGGLD